MGEKRKDQEDLIMIVITIITMTMTITVILGPETGINHITEIDHIVEIDHKTTIKITIEMTIEMTAEMTVEKKIIGISKTRNIGESIKIIMKTHMKTGTLTIAALPKKIVIETNI